MITTYADTASVGSAENGKGTPLRFPWLRWRPSTNRLMLSASTGPARTAKTPAFGRGLPTIVAMSPARKYSDVTRLERWIYSNETSPVEFEAGLLRPTWRRHCRHQEAGIEFMRIAIVQM